MWEECRLFNFRVIGEEKGYIRVVSNFMKTTGKSDRLCSRLFFVPTCLALAFFSRASAGLLRVPIGLFFFFFFENPGFFLWLQIQVEDGSVDGQSYQIFSNPCSDSSNCFNFPFQKLAIVGEHERISASYSQCVL
jgi:hypothetical protein